MAMRKIVVSRGHSGGFGLSEAGIRRMRQLGSIHALDATLIGEYWPAFKDRFGETIHNKRERHEYSEDSTDPQCNRDDSILIQVLEEDFDAHKGEGSCMEIVEIPFDVKWEIDDYDGAEWIAEQHRRW